MLKKVIIILSVAYLVLGPGLVLATGERCCKDTDCKGGGTWETCHCEPSCDKIENGKPVGGRAGICAPPNTTVYCPPIAPTSITEIVDNIVSWILWVALIVAPVMAIISGLMFLMAGGNPGMVSKGKNILLWTIIGFLFILFSKGVLSLITSVLGV